MGAQGMNAVYVTQAGTTTAVCPIYETHGNMIEARNGRIPAFGTSNLRCLEDIRVGALTDDPKGRYRAKSLGHKQDDESGLVHLRARYNKPGRGRHPKSMALKE